MRAMARQFGVDRAVALMDGAEADAAEAEALSRVLGVRPRDLCVEPAPAAQEKRVQLWAEKEACEW